MRWYLMQWHGDKVNADKHHMSVQLERRSYWGGHWHELIWTNTLRIMIMGEGEDRYLTVMWRA